MSLIITALKQKLAPFGWVESMRREAKAYAVSAEEIQEIDAYLQKMGVNDPELRCACTPAARQHCWQWQAG